MSSAPVVQAQPATDTQARIKGLVEAERVVLFMKGDRYQPQCGFSASAVGLLSNAGVPFTTHDVYADEAIRQGIKTFANWPTIPQLYVDGLFIGGSDILIQMDASGELAEVLGVQPQPEVEQVSVHTVKEWLDDGRDFVFLDARTPQEQEIATLGARLLTQGILPELEGLPKDTELVFMCHHGVRSQGAATAFRQMGFVKLRNMVGGIDAWSCEIDGTVPRY